MSYPKKDGWMRMQLTMTSKTPRSEDEIKKLVTFGKTDDYEFGPVEQYGAIIKVILRHKEASK